MYLFAYILFYLFYLQFCDLSVILFSYIFIQDFVVTIAKKFYQDEFTFMTLNFILLVYM